jgi:hypothetical protein
LKIAVANYNKIRAGACAYVAGQVSAACKEAGHPKAALGATIVQHVATVGAAGAGAANLWQDRQKEKEEEKTKADAEKGKGTEEAPKEEAPKETKEAETPAAPEKETKGTQTDPQDLLHHDAEGAPKQTIKEPALEPEASTSGAKKEEKPAVPAKAEPAAPASPAAPAAPASPAAPAAPAAHKPAVSESHEMKPLSKSISKAE